MAELYFSIPLPNHAGLLEVADWLKAKLPATTQLVDPARYHITLAYAPNAEPMPDVTQLVPPIPLPVFGLMADYVEVWDTPENYAVVLRVDGNKQLTCLQVALFYALRMNGFEMSPYSFPAVYRPHVTLATIPKTEMLPPEQMYALMPVYLQVERFEATTMDYQVVGTFELLTQTLAATPLSEMGRISEAVQTQFSGEYPQIPPMAGVDMGKITEGDSDPMFVTLKVAQAGAISGNKRVYDDGFVKSLEQQMVTKRPIANQGHIPDEHRATSYPQPAGYWVGVKRVGDTLWGKVYVPPASPMREIVRARKAQNATINTSIYGLGNQEYDPQRGVWKVTDFELESVDFAPTERSGVPALATVPHITKELAVSTQSLAVSHEQAASGELVTEMIPDQEGHEESEMDKLDVLKELTAADVQHLPAAVVKAITEQSDAAKVLAELRKVFPEGDLVAGVTTLRQTIQAQNKAQVEAALVAEIANQVLPNAKEGDGDDDPVKSARAMVREMVTPPATVEAVAAAVKEVVTKAHVAAMLKRVVTSEMGPRQGSPVGGKQNDGESKYFAIPKEQ